MERQHGREQAARVAFGLIGERIGPAPPGKAGASFAGRRAITAAHRLGLACGRRPEQDRGCFAGRTPLLAARATICYRLLPKLMASIRWRISRELPVP